MVVPVEIDDCCTSVFSRKKTVLQTAELFQIGPIIELAF